MINLASRDIFQAWGKFVFTGFGLGLLVGVTLIMAGVYRGLVDDARTMLTNSGADLWVVQEDTLGPYAEPSSIPDDLWRTVRSTLGVSEAANATYLTMQLEKDGALVRTLVAGIAPGGPGTLGWPAILVAGRHLTRSHYEAVADEATGFRIGDVIRIRRHRYEVVGLTRRAVSTGGEPMVFIPLRDAQEAQFLPDNDAILKERRRAQRSPAFSSFDAPGLPNAVDAMQSQPRSVNVVLVRVKPGESPKLVAEHIRRWLRMTVYDAAEMEEILTGTLIAASARQIGMFLVILALVSAAIVAFIIYTLTMEKLREIAVLKLIGARNRVIVWMILQQALILGGIGFVVGKISATFSAPIFPKFVLLMPGDTIRAFFLLMVICVLASLMAIRLALKVDPAEAIG